MAAFATRLQPRWLPIQAARQLPEQSTTLRVAPTATGDTRIQGALHSMTSSARPWPQPAVRQASSRPTAAASGVVGEGPRGGPSALCAPFNVLYIFWRPVTAIRNGAMDGKPLQSRTLRDRSETALQCGNVKRSPVPTEQARRRTLM
jgi:hypothetical protein